MTENISKLNNCIDRFANLVNSFSQSAVMMNQSISQISQLSNSLYSNNIANPALNQNINLQHLHALQQSLQGLQGQVPTLPQPSVMSNLSNDIQTIAKLLLPQYQQMNNQYNNNNNNNINNNDNINNINNNNNNNNNVLPGTSSPTEWVQLGYPPKSNNGIQQTPQQIHVGPNSDTMNPLTIPTSQQVQNRRPIIQGSPILHSMSTIDHQIKDPSLVSTLEKEKNLENNNNINNNNNNNNQNKESVSNVTRSTLSLSNKKNITPDMEDKLNKLKEMGYENSNFCLILLQQNKGDLNKAIEDLKRFYKR